MEFREDRGIIECLRCHGLIELRGCAATDEHHSHVRLMQRPCKREVRPGVTGTGGHGLQPCEPPMRFFVKIDILMPRHQVEARVGFHAVLVLRVCAATRERCVECAGD